MSNKQHKTSIGGQALIEGSMMRGPKGDAMSVRLPDGTNDTEVDPLNIVIKLQYVNKHPVAKISDVPTKAMCQDNNYLEYLKNAVNYRLKEGI